MKQRRVSLNESITTQEASVIMKYLPEDIFLFHPPLTSLLLSPKGLWTFMKPSQIRQLGKKKLSLIQSIEKMGQRGSRKFPHWEGRDYLFRTTFFRVIFFLAIHFLSRRQRGHFFSGTLLFSITVVPDLSTCSLLVRSVALSS